MKLKEDILCIIQIQNINTVYNISDLIKEYGWIKRWTDLCNTDLKKNKNPPDNQIKQSMREEGANKTVYPCHFLLKRLYQAKKVYGHVYVYYGFPCVWASVNYPYNIPTKHVGLVHRPLNDN